MLLKEIGLYFKYMKKSYAILIFLGLSLIFTTGCKVIDESRVHDDEAETIPWNTRAGWEGTTLGVPY